MCCRRKNNCVSTLNSEYIDLLKFKIDYKCCKEKPKHKFEEKRIVKVGDEIKIFGGDTDFLKSFFGKDTCVVKVKDIYFSKVVGSVAFLDITSSGQDSVVFSISLYYWDIARGYNSSNILAWERKMTDEEKEKLWRDFGGCVKYHLVEKNIGFSIIK